MKVVFLPAISLLFVVSLWPFLYNLQIFCQTYICSNLVTFSKAGMLNVYYRCCFAPGLFIKQTTIHEQRRALYSKDIFYIWYWLKTTLTLDTMAYWSYIQYIQRSRILVESLAIQRMGIFRTTCIHTFLFDLYVSPQCKREIWSISVFHCITGRLIRKLLCTAYLLKHTVCLSRPIRVTEHKAWLCT